MKISFFPVAVGLGLAFWPGMAQAAPVRSDLSSAQVRTATVDLASRLVQPPQRLSELPAAIPNPFNPPAFETPDAPVTRRDASAEPAKAIPAMTERQQLEEVVARLDPLGMMLRGDSPVLAFKGYQCAVGDVLTVRDPITGRSYELALTAIAATTFTVEHQGEAITRPIRKAP